MDNICIIRFKRSYARVQLLMVSIYTIKFIATECKLTYICVYIQFGNGLEFSVHNKMALAHLSSSLLSYHFELDIFLLISRPPQKRKWLRSAMMCMWWVPLSLMDSCHLCVKVWGLVQMKQKRLVLLRYAHKNSSINGIHVHVYIHWEFIHKNYSCIMYMFANRM